MVTTNNVMLTAGPQVMRLVMDFGSESNLVGDIDSLDFQFMGDLSTNLPPIAGTTWEATTAGTNAGIAYINSNSDYSVRGTVFAQVAPTSSTLRERGRPALGAQSWGRSPRIRFAAKNPEHFQRPRVLVIGSRC